jgi:hypothetical protein
MVLFYLYSIGGNTHKQYTKTIAIDLKENISNSKETAKLHIVFRIFLNSVMYSTTNDLK